MARLRLLNLIAAIILVAYNLALAVWPSVALNVAVALIDLVYLVGTRVRHPRQNENPFQD
jgi:hypothetical protein